MDVNKQLRYNHKRNVKVRVTTDRRVQVDRDGTIIDGKVRYKNNHDLNVGVLKAINYEFKRLKGILT